MRYLLIAVICLGGGLCIAQETKLQIDVYANDEDVADVMDRISRMTGKNIIVHPDVDARVTISLRNVSWKVAVQLIAERTGCKIEQYPGGVIGLKKPRRISLQFTDANVRTVIMLLADYADVNIIVGPDVTGQITVDLKDVEYLSALKAIVQTAGAGKYALVGSAAASERSRPLRIGDTQSKAKAPPTPKPKTLEGRLLKLGQKTVRLKQGEKEVVCDLPDDPSLRKRLRDTLGAVRKNARVVLTYVEDGKRKVAQDLIAQSR